VTDLTLTAAWKRYITEADNSIWLTHCTSKVDGLFGKSIERALSGQNIVVEKPLKSCQSSNLEAFGDG